MDLFIHLLVHLFVYLFIDMSIPLSVHSFTTKYLSSLHILKEGKQRLIWLFHSLQSFKWIGPWSKCFGWLVGLSPFWHRKKGGQLKKSLCIKIWIVVHWKKVTRDWSDCCTLYKVSNQWYYGSTAILGWKRSNALFSPCTSSDVAFIRLGMDMANKRVLMAFNLRMLNFGKD